MDERQMVNMRRFGAALAGAANAAHLPELYECEDCEWPWPLPGKPPAGSECDNCGGELVPAAR